MNEQDRPHPWGWNGYQKLRELFESDNHPEPSEVAVALKELGAPYGLLVKFVE